jgi:DNA-directed RNA polymerase subunit E'/Rpb7
MKGPYFITSLEADIRVRPDQMDNNIIDNIKRNLEQTYANRCYENYGYIDKIYDVVDDIKGGIIRAEDITSSSVHRVQFKCRICNPIKKTIIMGRISGINNMIIVAENGPIKFIIGENDINKDNVQYRKNAYYPVTSDGEIINKPISKGTYVMIQIMNKKIVKNKPIIFVFGRLESVVLDENVMNVIRTQYEESESVIAQDLIHKFDTDEQRESELVQENTGQEPIEADDEVEI